jgi:hypothetical protein
MGFVAISIDKYIKKHLDRNPSENEIELRKQLNSALHDYKNGVKCSCGNDIWVIGSASVGNTCFTCITGVSQPDSDYEIDSAIVKSENKNGQRHINDIEPTKIAGFFDDDGYEINTDLIRKPGLCMTCVHDNDPKEEILCNMNIYNQKDNADFKCFAYKMINS